MPRKTGLQRMAEREVGRARKRRECEQSERGHVETEGEPSQLGDTLYVTMVCAVCGARRVIDRPYEKERCQGRCSHEHCSDGSEEG